MEHAVIIHFKYGHSDLDPLFALEERLEAEIAANSVGEYDGNEIAVDGSEGTLYMYGPDADRLFQTVHPILESVPFMKGAIARLRYGPPEEGVREKQITIGGIEQRE